MNVFYTIVTFLLICAVVFYQMKASMYKDQNERLRRKNMSEEEKAQRLREHLKEKHEAEQKRISEENGL